MAMVVKNNMSAISTLNTLNKNSAGLTKSLAKVSSGQRINGAADDASGYAISERMRVQVRALDQDNRNTQSGTSMMKVAEGAVSSTVDILKTLKEKVVSAANDDKTDSDRAAIQKELDQSIDQINDNANVTFNGKYLVDGSHNNEVKKGGVANTMTNESLHKTTDAKTQFSEMKDRNGNSLNIQETDTVTISFVREGRTYEASVKGSDNFTNLLDAANATQGSVRGKALSAGDTMNLGSTVTFGKKDGTTTDNNLYVAGSNEKVQDLADTIAKAIKQTFAVKNGVHDSAGVAYVSTYTAKTQVSFDLKIGKDGSGNGQTVGKITIDSGAFRKSDGNYMDSGRVSVGDVSVTKDGKVSVQVFMTNSKGEKASIDAWVSDSTLRVADVKTAIMNDSAGMFGDIIATSDSMAGLQKDVNFEKASGSNVFAAGNSVFTVHDASYKTMDSARQLDKTVGGIGTSDLIGQDRSDLDVYTADRGNAITFTASNTGTKGQVAGVTIKVEDQYGTINKSANAVLDNFSETIKAEDQSSDNAIVLQVGTKANQAIKVGLTDMRAEALGLRSTSGENIQIGTQKQANVAINVLDNAISKALDQQTTIGSVQSRLEYTSTNLTTASENVTASESTIRDADMAKEMTEYTKNNVLLQAAQSMLAQANQNSSAVLSLLQ